MKKILQVNFKYNISFDELLKIFKDAAPLFVNMKGLEWKIWMHDAEKNMCGGIWSRCKPVSVSSARYSRNWVRHSAISTPKYSTYYLNLAS